MTSRTTIDEERRASHRRMHGEHSSASHRRQQESDLLRQEAADVREWLQRCVAEATRLSGKKAATASALEILQKECEELSALNAQLEQQAPLLTRSLQEATSARQNEENLITSVAAALEHRRREYEALSDDAAYTLQDSTALEQEHLRLVRQCAELQAIEAAAGALRSSAYHAANIVNVSAVSIQDAASRLNPKELSHRPAATDSFDCDDETPHEGDSLGTCYAVREGLEHCRGAMLRATDSLRSLHRMDSVSEAMKSDLHQRSVDGMRKELNDEKRRCEMEAETFATNNSATVSMLSNFLQHSTSSSYADAYDEQCNAVANAQHEFDAAIEKRTTHQQRLQELLADSSRVSDLRVVANATQSDRDDLVAHIGSLRADVSRLSKHVRSKRVPTVKGTATSVKRPWRPTTLHSM